MKRIGFIAMSGVRAHNPELTKLGLTLPGFVDRNKIIASLPSLGLLTLAGLTPDAFDIEYHEIADLYRAKGIPVVIGGITASSLPQEAGEHCASVVIGEGEPLWPEVLDDFARGRLKPRYAHSSPGQFDLSDAPLPRFDLLDPAK